MAVTGVFQADFSNFDKAVVQSEAHLKNLEGTGQKVESSLRLMTQSQEQMLDKIGASGGKIQALGTTAARPPARSTRSTKVTGNSTGSCRPPASISAHRSKASRTLRRRPARRDTARAPGDGGRRRREPRSRPGNWAPGSARSPARRKRLRT